MASISGSDAHETIRKGNENEVAALLSRGLDPNSRTEGGWTLLYIASVMGHEAVVRRLLEAGADVDGLSNDGQTALQIVTYKQSPDANDSADVAGELVPDRPNLGWQWSLATFLLSDDMRLCEILQAILENHVRRNEYNAICAVLRNASDLRDAVRCCEVARVKDLLEAGASPNLANEAAETLLHIALRFYLQQSSSGATGNNSPEAEYPLLEVLVDAPGVDVARRNKLGQTPLWIASKEGHGVIVELLLKYNDTEKDGTKNSTCPSINLPDNDGYTPLSIAVKTGRHSVVQCLMSNGANVKDSTTKPSLKPLYIARKRNDDRMVELLEDRHAPHTASSRTVYHIGVQINGSHSTTNGAVHQYTS
ncbi:hypothetical protein SDRG_12390 [Saprolegnia diclina VS20]|uniref:Uncharacterized protein n=1 Tax=Saprolegnia diclina (strain VS20) TaxID=1156394 RepID=T0RC87_SAPDV|nr:hypothetical protein SDRG_12390 [Saprolegnia diclina VS20]EQC29843.1 hypothetical protein SDRG_12390 [Saprolegnia diclina VS20]|eukprot:XP_008616682.1 hypothetical protein SDRG_12390 [Saprolegnia diclina VS20]